MYNTKWLNTCQPCRTARYRGGMARVIYNTATTLNGFLADDENSLSWLFVVPGADAGRVRLLAASSTGIGALVMGSTTYEWILEHENLARASREVVLRRHRELRAVARARCPRSPGADIRFRSGDVDDLWAELRDAAGDRDIWLVGGGDLVGQFADAGPPRRDPGLGGAGHAGLGQAAAPPAPRVRPADARVRAPGRTVRRAGLLGRASDVSALTARSSPTSGCFGSRPSPDDVPVSRRRTQGPTCSR